MIESHGQTDVGRKRKLNEDNFLVDPRPTSTPSATGWAATTRARWPRRWRSRRIAAFIEKSHREKEITWPYGLDVNLSFDGNRLKTAIKLANKKVFKAADNREDYTGMGTTRWPRSSPGT
jgi:serine/threonine protein phosphatase PrpC